MPAAAAAPAGHRKVAAAAAAVACLSLLAPAVARGRTFYVSPEGADRHAGLSPSRPWRTVARVNRARLRPGDRVLLRGGARFAHALMPRASGRPGAPIEFSSYGTGRARLAHGIWFRRRHDLVFHRLAMFGAGVVGHGHRISLTASAIEHTQMAVAATGTDWWIADNRIADVGDSGLILTGRRMGVAGNTIERTGRDRSIGYGKHGIYLKAADAHVKDNAIRDFADNGISVRFRNSRIEGNVIEGGPIGIAWFQYDRRRGTSAWTSNAISRTTSAGIYVSRSDRAGATRESFVIRTNRLQPRSGRSLDLGPTLGFYDVLDNLEG